MLTVKKKVILLSCLGVIPFYSDILISLINNFYNVKLFQKINLVSYLYGALISCFLCGMQWVKFPKNIMFNRFKNNNYHRADYNLYWMNMRENLTQRLSKL